jgi:hypothetical protein
MKTIEEHSPGNFDRVVRTTGYITSTVRVDPAATGVKMIQVSEDALDSVKAMAQKIQEERDMLLAALKKIAGKMNTDAGSIQIALDALIKVERE